jgi:integrase
MANTKNPSLRYLFFFGFHTGMRQNEITNLQWDAVNFKDNVIRVQITDSFMTKSRRERVIPINNNLRELLVKLHSRSSSKYVFTNPSGYKYHNDYISHQFKKAVRGAGLDDRIHFHDLRHDFASSLVQRGVSLYVVKDLLGHEDQTTTQIYAHLQNKNLHDAIGLLD